MAGGYLSNAMRRSAPEIDTGRYVENVGGALEEMPLRTHDLSRRVYGPGLDAISRSRQMRGVDDLPIGQSNRLDAIYRGMRDRAARAGDVDVDDMEAVLRWAEANDPTDSTMEAARMIREQMRRPSGGSLNGTGGSIGGPAYPQTR